MSAEFPEGLLGEFFGEFSREFFRAPFTPFKGADLSEGNPVAFGDGAGIGELGMAVGTAVHNPTASGSHCSISRSSVSKVRTVDAISEFSAAARGAVRPVGDRPRDS